MRLVVTGKNGQVTRALQEIRAPGIEIIALGRPDFELAAPESVASALRAAQPDVIVNAAAYTAVDKAESEPDVAFAINAEGARAVAEAAAALSVPLIQLSTDYVFDGAKTAPYSETDPPAPVSVYGASKLAGEAAVAMATPDHVILRLAWVYSPFGANFVRTILRLAETRDEIAVVADQSGGPTSAHDIAASIAQIGANLVARPAARELRGVFHLSPAGEANWAELAEAILQHSADRGGPSARVRPITTAEYPTAAKRPANSRLDGAKLAAAHGVRLGHWRTSLAVCVDRLVSPAETDTR